MRKTLMIASSVAGMGLLIATLLLKDAGPHVKIVKPVTHPVPLALIHMTTVKTGWAVGLNGTVLSTLNGGASWAVRSPHLDPGGSLSWAASAYTGVFFRRGLAWAVLANAKETRVLATQNHGETWTAGLALPLPAGRTAAPARLVFVSPNRGWALFAWPRSAAPPLTEQSRLFATTDGGHSWQLLQPTGLPRKGLQIGLAFATPNIGWAVVSGPGGMGDGAAAYRTRTGGRRWRAVALPSPNPSAHLAQLGLPQFFPGGRGIFPAEWQTAHGFFTDFLRTSDNGRTWTPTERVGPSRAFYGLAPGAAGRAVYQFISPERGWFDTQGVLYRTTNGGSTWTRVESRPHLVGVTQIDFITARDGWATAANQGKFTLWRTTDGGNTWGIP